MAGLGPEGRKGRALDERIEILSCAPHHDGLFAPAEKVLDHLVRLLDITGHAVVFSRGEEIHHMMGYALPLGLRRLSGADGHTLIDLHGVRRHHLAVKPVGQGDPQLGFACGGGAADHDERLFHTTPLVRCV